MTMTAFDLGRSQNDVNDVKWGKRKESGRKADCCVVMRRAPRPASETFTTCCRRTKAGEVFLDSSARFYGGG